MASSIFGQQGGNSIIDAVNALRNAAGGNLQAACRILDNAGIVRTLPSGQQVTASQFAQMMQGQMPEQAFRDNGLNFEEFRNFF